MKRKEHKQDPFERDIVAFLERRKGQSIDDELLGQFATYFWRKKVAFELSVMRQMVS